MEDFIEHLERLGIIAVDSVSNMIAKRNSKNVMEKTQIEILNQQQYKQKVYKFFEPDYNNFAGKLRNCLQSNNIFYGLSHPKLIDDVCCSKWSDRVDGILFWNGTYRNVIFRYEVKRETVNMNIHTLSAGTLEYVPVEKAERLLQQDLPKYCGDYSYAGLMMTEITEERVRITISGVDRSASTSGRMMAW